MTGIDDDQPARTRAERRQDRSRAARRRTARPVPPTRQPPEPVPVPEAGAEDEVGLTRRERRELREAKTRRTAAPSPPLAAPPAESEQAPEPEPDVVPEPDAAPAETPREPPAAIPEPDPAVPAVATAPVAAPEDVPVAPVVTGPPSTRRERRLASTAPARARRPSSRGRERPTPNRDDRRFWTRVVPLIALSLALLVAIGAVMRAADDGGSPRRTAAVSPSGVRTKTLLLVHHSAAYGNDLIVLVGREQNRGSVLMVPGATQLDVPSLGVATLSAVPVDDNGAGLANSVENVVGVGVGKTAMLDDAGLTAVLGPAAPLPVTLTNPIEIVGTGAKYDAGAQRVSAAQAAELMSGPQAVNELDRLVTASAVIEGWLTRLEDPSVARRTLALSRDLAPLVAAATAKDGYRIDTLPVDSIATGGGERFGVRNAELERYVARSFSADRLGSGIRRPRVEVLNGTGFLGVAQAVAQAVVPAGGKVTLTENVPGFGVPTTQIVYYKDSWRDGAQRLLDAMKCGSLRKASRDLGIADVTIVVGLDCPQYGVPGGNH